LLATDITGERLSSAADDDDDPADVIASSAAPRLEPGGDL